VFDLKEIFSMKINKRNIEFDSIKNEAKIRAIVVEPESNNEVKAILQIAHGMAEHSGRYLDFAYFMAKNGFAVYMDDHIGHGASMIDENAKGYFGSCGYLEMVADLSKLSKIARSEHKNKPLIVMGHSMGSFLIREYIAKYNKENLHAAILIGTSAGSSSITMKSGILLAKTLIAFKGKRSYLKVLEQLATGSYNKSFKPYRTDFDWLSRDEKQVDLYIKDPLCGFMFTASAYLELIKLLHNINLNSWYEKVDKNLPILLLCGDKDPVGDFSKGVVKIYNKLKSSNHKVNLKIYEGARHELLNETNKDIVYNDILNFINETL
jgi:alpha-beta hydrolase superfamily lysophospholipase